MAIDLITHADLRDYFRDAGVSQSTLARSLGISERQVNRFVNGHAPIPQATQIAIYALMFWKNTRFTHLIERLSCRDE